MPTGTIKKIAPADRGFGFITPEDGGAELFFHRSGVEGNLFEALREGQHVTFDLDQSDRGPRAKNVRAV